MNTLYMKQKVFSLRGRFSIKDADENNLYFVEGSFMKLPKSFTISDKNGYEITTITKKTFSFLPTFYVRCRGGGDVNDFKRVHVLQAALHN